MEEKNFSRIRQSIDYYMESEQLTSTDDVLRLLIDLFDDVKAITKKPFYELPRDDEEDVKTKIVRVGNDIGRLYKRNEDIFSEASAQKSWNRVEKKLAGLFERKEALEKEIKAMQDQIAIIKETDQAIVKQLKEYGSLEELKNKEAGLLKQYQDTLADCTKIQGEIEELEKIQIPGAKQNYQNIVDQKNLLSKELFILKNNYDTVCNNYSELSNEYDTELRKIEKLRIDHNKLNEEKEGLVQSQKILQEQIGVCITDNKKLSDSLKQLNDAIDSEIKKQKSLNISIANQKLEKEQEIGLRSSLESDLECAISEYQSELKINNDIRSKIQNQNDEKSKLVIGRDKLVKELEGLYTEANSLKADIKGYNITKETLKNNIETYKNQIEKAKSDCTDLTNKIGEEKSSVETIASRRTTLNNELILLQQQNSTQNQINEGIQKQVDGFKDNFEKLEEVYKYSVDKIDEYEGKIKELKDKLEKNQSDESNYKDEVERLTKQLSVYKTQRGQNYADVKRLRKKTIEEYVTTKMSIRRYNDEQNRIIKEQEHLSKIANALFEDSVLSGNWMFTSTKELENRLNSQLSNMKNMLTQEQNILKDLLRALEG